MYNFVKSVGEKDVLLTKPDIVAFLVVGSDGDILLSSCDYINNIRPALAAMLDKLKESDELAVDYVRSSFSTLFRRLPLLMFITRSRRV